MYVSPGWFIVATLFAVSVAGELGVIHERPTGGPEYAAGAAFAVLFGASILAHELGHSVISLIVGLRIRRVTLYLLGGIAEIESEPRSPGSETLIAFAGPLVSLLLGGLFLGLGATLPDGSDAARIAFLLGETNVWLGAFNLLPGLPLDGGRVLRAAAWAVTGDRERATRWSARGGQVLAAAVAITAVGIAGQDIGTAILPIIVATFIWQHASAVIAGSDARARVRRVSVRGLLRPCLPLRASVPLAEALRQAEAAGARPLVVDSYGAPAGLLAQMALEKVPSQRRPWVTLGDVTRRLVPELVIPPDLSGEGVLEALRRDPSSDYLVVSDDGDVLGLLVTSDVVAVLSARA